MTLRPFFPYFGSKWRLAPRYPAPKHSLVIEPFAGSAGYAVRHGVEHALLIDLDENIVAVWSYLIRATAAEILALPDFEAGEEIRGVIPEAAALIGFWANRGSSQPKPTMQKWGDQHDLRVSSWGPLARERIAGQLDRIRRWSIRLGSFDVEPDHRATWFIDPPYLEQGFRYRKHEIDFAALASWCRARRGQVIVCEGPGARWLPFEPLCLAKTKSGFAPEFVFLQNDPPRRDQRFCSECGYEITLLSRAAGGALRAAKTCGAKCARLRKTRLERERRGIETPAGDLPPASIGGKSVAALFVERGGSYYGIPDVDPWDQERDARNYAGPYPVVAHPPCGRWCRLASMVEAQHPDRPKGIDGGSFAAALAAVRRWGGVLEHPAKSDAWAFHGLQAPPKTGWGPRDAFGGASCLVEQGHYGHPARKPTWLYAAHVDLPDLRWGPSDAEGLVSWVGNSRKRAGRRILGGNRILGSRLSSKTPAEFRELLLSIARAVRAPRRSRDLPQTDTCGKSHRGELAENFVFGSLDTEALTSCPAADQKKALTSITPPVSYALEGRVECGRSPCSGCFACGVLP